MAPSWRKTHNRHMPYQQLAAVFGHAAGPIAERSSLSEVLLVAAIGLIGYAVKRMSGRV